MNPELERLLQDTIRDLNSNPSTITASSSSTYADKVRANWKPYAQAHDLPTDFTDESARALTADEIIGFMIASRLGDTRSHNRDGQHYGARLGKALAPSTLEGALAALRDAHLKAHLAWPGDDPRIKEIRRSYRATSTHTETSATPLTRDHLHQLFSTTSRRSATDKGTVHARARATALALKIPVTKLPMIEAKGVHISGTSATVRIAGIEPRTTQCLRTRIDDPIASAACAHCQLRMWLQNAPDTTYVPRHEIASVRQAAKILVSRLEFAHYEHNHIAIDDEDLWTTIALGLDRASGIWMRMRAALLPMWAAGLRLSDIEHLHRDQIAFAGQNVTMSIVGKTEDASRPHVITLTPEGGPMCPVAAMRHYDAWTSAFLPQRTRWTPPLRGTTSSSPSDVAGAPGSRALYQQARLWLLESGIEIGLDAYTRPTLTPHSARHGFAQQAEADGIPLEQTSEAMRHTRQDTTEEYLGSGRGNTSANLLSSISEDLR